MVYIHVGNGVYRPWIAANLPCSNSNQLEGVFRPVTSEQAMSSNASHAAHYARCIAKFIDGEYSGTGMQRYGEMWRDIASFKMTGAYGEVL